MILSQFFFHGVKNAYGKTNLSLCSRSKMFGVSQYQLAHVSAIHYSCKNKNPKIWFNYGLGLVVLRLSV